MPLELAALRARYPGREILWLETTTSTMEDAARLAAAGCSSGSLAIAERQTAGRGRFGRSWHSESGAGLYLTLVLQRNMGPATLPVLTLAMGLAVREAIAGATGLVCDLRWPNDVLIGNGKCAGVLLETAGDAVLAGIGINVNQAGFPAEAGEATSLRLAGGRPYSRERILEGLLAAVDEHLKLLAEQGAQPVLDLFTRASSYVAGRRVVVRQTDAELAGATAGLDPSGFLRLRHDDGRESLILAGGVRPAG